MLNKWVEIGNSGMFRPEMLEPMGFPKDVRVLGWGLSLERPTMIRFDIFSPGPYLFDDLTFGSDMVLTTLEHSSATASRLKASRRRQPSDSECRVYNI